MYLRKGSTWSGGQLTEFKLLPKQWTEIQEQKKKQSSCGDGQLIGAFNLGGCAVHFLLGFLNYVIDHILGNI